MNGRLSTVVTVLALVIGCAPEEQDRSLAVFDIADLVPSVSSMPEWTVAEKLTEYTPDTLFEYINGAASQYLSYRFKKLAHIRYAYRGDDFSSITLDIYDMGSRLGAYGIYTAGRPRDIASREWGAEGYRSGTIAVAWKQRIYIHASADDETPALVKMLEQLMAQVASAIPGDDSKPDILSALPTKDLIAYTDRYIGKDLLGHSFLPGGFLANYEVDGRECLLFFSDLGSVEAADDVMGRLRAYEEEQGKVLSEGGPIGADAFWAEDPGLGVGVVTRVGRYVAGIWGVPSKTVAREILGEFVANLEQSS